MGFTKLTIVWKLESYTELLQSHISENQGEVAAVRGLYHDCSSYADVYGRAKLLTDKVSHSQKVCMNLMCHTTSYWEAKNTVMQNYSMLECSRLY
jgi:hypothetical protein